MTVKARSKVAKIKGIPVHYLETGKGEEVILYLHGAGGRPPSGASFPSLLAQKGSKVLLPSRPGYDETPIGECKTQSDVAQVMCAFVDKVAGVPVHVVGQSAGAGVACWMAIHRPDLIKSLVLSAPSVFEVRPAGQPSGPPSPEELEHRLYGDTPTWTEPPTQADRERIRVNASQYMAWSRATDTKGNLLERLSEIASPTLIVWATHDRMLLPESTVPLQKNIANSFRVLIYGAAHELPISAAERWVELIGDFTTRRESFVVAHAHA